MELVNNNVEQIKVAYEQAQQFADTAKANAAMAIQSAMLCGKLLVEQKDNLEHGEWLPWLELNCPWASEPTAQRYMRLAKASHVMDLDNCASLRQAYIAAGILPEPEPAQATKQLGTPKETYLLHIQKVCQYFNAHLKPAQLNDTAKEVIREQLKPLAKLFKELGGQL